MSAIGPEMTGGVQHTFIFDVRYVFLIVKFVTVSC